MIAITFALPAESLGLRRLVRGIQIGPHVLRTEPHGKTVDIVHTGVGSAVARARLTAYLESAQPSLLISSGFAGAARSNVRVGDLVAAENYSDQELLERARRALRRHNVLAAKIFSADEIIDDIEGRGRIAAQHEALAIDMESAVIAEICAQRGIRLLVLRVLSDTPRHPLPVPPEVLFDLGRQRTSAGRLTGYLVRHPAAIFRLIGFAGQVRKARRNLTAALGALLSQNFPYN